MTKSRWSVDLATSTVTHRDGWVFVFTPAEDAPGAFDGQCIKFPDPLPANVAQIGPRIAKEAGEIYMMARRRTRDLSLSGRGGPRVFAPEQDFEAQSAPPCGSGTVYKVHDSLAAKYHGCGYALAAIGIDGNLIDIAYCRDIDPDFDDEQSPEDVALAIAESDLFAAHGQFFEVEGVSWMAFGMLSCWEFVVL